jgi:phosphocarrier protein HPr
MGTANIEATEKGHRACVMVTNSLGLHLRPASQLVKLASGFPGCEIEITKDGQTINAKSIMGVIMLAAEQGSELTIEACGDGSDAAVLAIVQIVEQGFNEA